MSFGGRGLCVLDTSVCFVGNTPFWWLISDQNMQVDESAKGRLDGTS